jgi:hypothetical protein
MWIKSKEGLFNSTAYRSIVAEHFQPEGPGDKLMSVVVGRTGQRVKFLPPIPVKGWEAPETVPATRLVK